MTGAHWGDQIEHGKYWPRYGVVTEMGDFETPPERGNSALSLRRASDQCNFLVLIFLNFPNCPTRNREPLALIFGGGCQLRHSFSL